MQELTPGEKLEEVLKTLMPEATDDERKQAADNLKRYADCVLQIGEQHTSSSVPDSLLTDSQERSRVEK